MIPNKKDIMTRYFFIILLLMLVGLGIICKAGVIMFAERQYWKEVADRFVKENVVVKSIRGNILSADGQLMASSLPEYKIYMDFQAGGINKDTILYNKLDSICEGLNRIFPDKSKTWFRNNILKGRRKRSRGYLLYPNRISYIQYKQAKELPLFKLSRYTSGFYEVAFNQRKKPFGSLAKRTLGDMYSDVELGAKNGLELYYDSVLRGTPGITHRQKVMNKYLNIVDIPPVDGCDIITTLDVTMQDIAEKALVDELKDINATTGVAILMEVKTGDVKAIVNMTKCDDGEYREIKNNAVADMMEPGSTFKTASIMVALEDGKITPNQTIDTGNGIYNMYGRLMKDHNWNKGGYGVLTTTQTLMYSSNIGVSRLIDQNYHNTPSKFVKGLYKLGIGTPLKIDIPGTGKPYIRMPSKSNWYKTALAWMSIGYETQIPPINTVTFYNAIANNGVMVKPRFVKAIMRGNDIIKENPVEVLKPAIASPKTIKEIRTILRKVVSEGLGKRAGSEHFKVSGKTGTAQVSNGKEGYKNGGTHYLVSFCGYFPSDNPKYTCLVAIRKPGLPASGGTMAGGVFKKISERVYARHLALNLSEAKDTVSVLKPDVKRGDINAASYVLSEISVNHFGDCESTTGKPIWGNTKTNEKEVLLSRINMSSETIPNVIGMGAKDAVYLLESLGIKVKINGVGKVKAQSLPYGKHFSKGEFIQLRLN